jgi:hypothetical protein
MGDGELEKRTWTPQQIPANVSGTKPRQDPEPKPEPPKDKPERR